jgi:hypothetical protein
MEYESTLTRKVSGKHSSSTTLNNTKLRLEYSLTASDIMELISI